jgi:hypothetical protein
MNTRVIATVAALALAAATVGGALDRHSVVYTEGDPQRRAEGVEESIGIGDVLQTGDSVVTGDADRVELEAGTYKVTIAENTVFSLLEVEDQGQSQPVLTAALGKLSFARQRVGGSEPRLAGSAAICGVRGTVVTVLSGADGSTLVVVDEGAVEVTAAGGRVSLARGEAVEVPTGAAPGAKFQALSREIDFRKWNGLKVDTMVKDPVAAAQRVEKQLDGCIEQIHTIMPLYREKRAQADKERSALAELRARGDVSRTQEFYRNTVFPLELQTTKLYVNVRYYALSSLSLRRFVTGRLYAMAKGRFIGSPGSADYQAFLAAHRGILDKFEREIVPYLVAADV